MADKQISDLTAASAIDGTELIHVVQGGNSRKATAFDMRPFVGFRATTSTTQSISAATTTEVNFGTEVFDTEGAFASNRFTVPASLDGEFMVFSAGIRTAAAENATLLISKSTNGGSSFTPVVSISISVTSNIAVSTGAIQVATGEIFNVEYFSSDASQISDEDRTFFSGHRV